MNYYILGIVVVGLLLVGSVSAYVCIYQEDNDAVKEFKNKLNILSIKEDIKQGMTQEAILIKTKLFNPCK